MAKDQSREAVALAPHPVASNRTAYPPKSKQVEEDSCCGNTCCGAQASSSGEKSNDQKSAIDIWTSYLPTLVSFILLLSGIILDYLQVHWFAGSLRILTYGAAFLLVGWRVVWHAVQGIRKGRIFNEFFLMSIATLGAFYLGKYAEGVTVMLFYIIGEHFQEAAVARSRQSIKALMDNRPDEVSLLQDGQIVQVAARQVKKGALIQVRAGEKVALDGELLSAYASFDTAALTGESMPDTKAAGDKVLAGMINLDKVAQMRVEATYENSTLSKILHLVEEASSRKAKTQQFIARFAKVYTPIVVLLATAVTLLPYLFVDHYIFSDWFYRALVFLVISCPCALVISIPLGYFGGIGAASRHGILFKGASYLDQMAKVNILVMDKTGTLTKGIFSVQKAVTTEGMDEDWITLAAMLEVSSTHPVAKAVVAYAKQEGKSLAPVEELQEIAGQGLKGIANGQHVLVGNQQLMKQEGIITRAEAASEDHTVLYVAINGQYAGYFVLADALKEDAHQAIERLRHLGIRQLVMLSGDKETIVQQVAQQLKIDKAFGALLPQEKMAKVEALQQQGNTVAFVGDGINDAPVITRADIGIAMGGLGSDAAIETADVVIQTDQPSKIATAIRISRKTRQVVWQNIALAFGIKALVMVLGAFGVASLWEAVFADVGVALLAILNAVRIQQMKFR